MSSSDGAGTRPGDGDDEADPQPPVAAGGPGFTDPTLLAGRPPSSYLHVVILVIAAATDLAAFYQVIARAMGDTYEPLVFLVLIGFTAIVLYLAHVTGVIFRNHKARAGATSWPAAIVCLLVLAGLGAVAFYVRLHYPTSSPRSTGSFTASATATATPTSGGGEEQLVNAVVFLGLFVATVTAAAVGAYLTHNPLREGYATAARIYQRWSARTAVAEAAYLLAKNHEAAEDAERGAALKVVEAQTRRIHALAAELKQLGRVRVLAAKGDPAVTDAWMGEDQRPYVIDPHDPPTDGPGI